MKKGLKMEKVRSIINYGIYYLLEIMLMENNIWERNMKIIN